MMHLFCVFYLISLVDVILDHSWYDFEIVSLMDGRVFVNLKNFVYCHYSVHKWTRTIWGYKKHLVLEMWNNGNFIYMILSEGLPHACFVCDEQCNTQTRTKYGSKGSNVKHSLKSSCDVTDHSCRWWKKTQFTKNIFKFVKLKICYWIIFQ